MREFLACFLKVMSAEMRKQYRVYFFNKSIYLSLFLWPMLTFITAYYDYKPFRLELIAGGMGYINEKNLILFALIGYLCMIFFRCFVQSAWIFSSERINGTLELIYITPANRLAVIMGNAAASLFGSIWLFIVFACGIVLLNLSQLKFQIWSALVGIIFLLVLSILWGMFLNALFLFSRDSGFLFTVLAGPMEIFAGIKIPTTVFPIWAKAISIIFPLTYIAEMLRRIFLDRASIYELRGFIGASIIISIILLAATILCLKLGEHHAKKTGNMALF